MQIYGGIYHIRLRNSSLNQTINLTITRLGGQSKIAYN